MAWNLAYLKNKLDKRLQSDPFFLLADKVEAINEAIDDLVVFTRANQTVWTADGGTVVGLKEYALDAEWLFVDEVTVDGIQMNQMHHIGHVSSYQKAQYTPHLLP